MTCRRVRRTDGFPKVASVAPILCSRAHQARATSLPILVTDTVGVPAPSFAVSQFSERGPRTNRLTPRAAYSLRLCHDADRTGPGDAKSASKRNFALKVAWLE